MDGDADRAKVEAIQELALRTDTAQWCRLSDGCLVLLDPQDDGSVHWYVAEGGSDD